jgi:uncharacterized protein
MRLELKDIKDGYLLQELTCAASEFPVLVEMGRHEEAKITEPIQFQLRLQKSGQLVEVDGHLSTSIQLSCGRCLQAYETALASDFAFTFTPFIADDREPAENETEVELDSDELGLVFYRDEYLDLLHPLQDQLVMALPISPVCKEECKGLCTECGCNLNEKACHCIKKPFNNKFSALADLKVNPTKD